MSKEENNATILINLFQGKGEVFSDSYGEVYARIKVKRHWEIWHADTKKFKSWLSSLFYRAQKKACGATAINDAVLNLKGAALEKESRDLRARIVHYPEKSVIYYDLADPEWKAVRITPGGWKRVKNVKFAHFKRHPHMKEQCRPARGGDAKKILDFVNLDSDEARLLFLVHLISWFFPDIPKPIFLVFGEKGSAKSTFGRVISEIVDPSLTPLMPLQRNIKEVVEQLASHYVVIYDNLSGMSKEASDLFCQAVTGIGIQKRKLYTDSEAVIYTFMSCIGINGINNIAHSTDLLDRSILHQLERIDDKRMRTEKDFWNDFHKHKPRILGGIFDVISEVMGVALPKLKKGLGRMADFISLGCNIAKALGYSKKEFLRVYKANKKLISQNYIEESPLARVILKWCEERFQREASKGWGPDKLGAPSIKKLAEELFKSVTAKAETMGVNTDDKSWPKDASAFSRRLTPILSNLEELGVKIEKSRVKAGTRYTLTKLQKPGKPKRLKKSKKKK